jgi:hypothetical protein
MKFQFSALFGLGSLNRQVPIGAAPRVPVVPIGADSCRNDLTVQAPNGTQRHPTAPIGTENVFSERTWCFPTQLEWTHGSYPLRLWGKGRQVGATRTDAFDSVMKTSPMTSYTSTRVGLWTLDFGLWTAPLEVRAVLKKYERWTI